MWMPKVQIKCVVIVPTVNQTTSKNNLSFVKALFSFHIFIYAIINLPPWYFYISVLILANHLIMEN